MDLKQWLEYSAYDGRNGCRDNNDAVINRAKLNPTSSLAIPAKPIKPRQTQQSGFHVSMRKTR